MNPITRRPGPGRGRPRKQPNSTPGDATQANQLQPQPAAPMAPPNMGPPNMGPANMSPAPMPGAPMSGAHMSGAPMPGSQVPTADMGGGVGPPHMSDGLSMSHEVDDDLDEHAVKRPRLDDNTDPALEDEAMLNALAAHSSNTPVDHYGAE